MKTLKNLIWLPWSFLHGLLATVAVIILLFFKKNDGRKYSIFGHLSKFWGEWIAFGFGLKTDLQGLENLDPSQRYVFMANHESNIDVVVLMKALPFGFTMIGKQEARKVPIFGYGLYRSGVIFVDRKNPNARAEVVRQAVKCLQETTLSLYIFPEGKRGVNAGKFKSGGTRIAIESGLPIVPITLVDSGKFWPRKTLWQLNRNKRVKIIIGKPISTRHLSGDSSDKAVVSSLTDFVRDQVYKYL